MLTAVNHVTIYMSTRAGSTNVNEPSASTDPRFQSHFREITASKSAAITTWTGVVKEALQPQKHFAYTVQLTFTTSTAA